MTGNAYEWYEKAQAAGIPTTDASTPVVGSIAAFNSGYGHVAIVEEVRPDGSFVVSEMNVVNADPYGSGSGIISTSVHYPNESGLQGFIV